MTPETDPTHRESSPADDLHFLDHLQKVNEVFYDQIKIADQKSAFIFTVLVAFVLSSEEGKDVFRLQRYLAGDIVTIALSLVIVASVVVSLVSAILVVLPRHKKSSSSLYWGGWALHRATFIAARETGARDYLFDEYLGNVDALAAINRMKYRHVARSFRGLMGVVVAYVLLLCWTAV